MPSVDEATQRFPLLVDLVPVPGLQAEGGVFETVEDPDEFLLGEEVRHAPSPANFSNSAGIST